MRKGVQLYTLRRVDESPAQLVERAAAAGFDGVELAGVDVDSTAPLAAALAESNVSVASAHVPFETLQRDLSAVATALEPLGVRTLVVPYLDPSRFVDLEAVRETAQALDDLAERAADEGMRLAYHNHEHEFLKCGGVMALDVLLAGCDVDLELDVGWAHAAGADPTLYIERYADRITHLHLKDVVRELGAPRGARPVDLGTGEVDLGACIEAAERAGVEWLIFEHDSPEDPIESLDAAGRWFQTPRMRADGGR